MIIRNIIFIFILMPFLGCTTTSKNQSQNAKSLQDRVVYLEQELQRKDEKIKQLEQKNNPQNPTVVVFNSDSSAASTLPVVKKEDSVYQPTDLQIQRALKNAGFYKGDIDGKIGPKTLQAIKDFQKAHGLTPDGKVGLKTWAVLKVFLN